MLKCTLVRYFCRSKKRETLGLDARPYFEIELASVEACSGEESLLTSKDRKSQRSWAVTGWSDAFISESQALLLSLSKV